MTFKMFHSQKVTQRLLVSLMWVFALSFSFVFVCDTVSDVQFYTVDACVAADVEVVESDDEETFESGFAMPHFVNQSYSKILACGIVISESPAKVSDHYRRGLLRRVGPDGSSVCRKLKLQNISNNGACCIVNMHHFCFLKNHNETNEEIEVIKEKSTNLWI
ncbi:MAG: hypothetical protein SPL42_10165 [Bacteroidales bacterium]|nr:hypothetical protein [Bacteroidales bacterium]MDY6348771.1 hypothetical protein [Bacteroidales bacterium]